MTEPVPQTDTTQTDTTPAGGAPPDGAQTTAAPTATAVPATPAAPSVATPVGVLNDSNPLRDPADRRLPRVPEPCALVVFGVTDAASAVSLLDEVSKAA